MNTLHRFALQSALGFVLVGVAVFSVGAADEVGLGAGLNVAHPRYQFPEHTSRIASGYVGSAELRPVGEVLGRSTELARIRNGMVVMDDIVAHLLAAAVDVERLARGEVAQVADHLGRAGRSAANR